MTGKTKIGTEVTQVTRDSDTTFKVKGQGHQAAFLTAALTRQAAAAVSVGTYWAWEPTATLRVQARSAQRREALRRPQMEERGRDILWRPPAYSLLEKKDEVVRTAAALSARLRSCHLLTMKYNLEESQKLCFCLKF